MPDVGVRICKGHHHTSALIHKHTQTHTCTKSAELSEKMVPVTDLTGRHTRRWLGNYRKQSRTDQNGAVSQVKVNCERNFFFFFSANPCFLRKKTCQHTVKKRLPLTQHNISMPHMKQICTPMRVSQMIKHRLLSAFWHCSHTSQEIPARPLQICRSHF